MVIVDEEGRIERFLEKPGWGQVFSDTINTGIYVLEPEVLGHIPPGEPYDFSHELFPKLFEHAQAALRRALSTATGRTSAAWSSTSQANRDALDGKVNLQIPGVRLRGNIWVGQGVEPRNARQRRRAGGHRQLREDRSLSGHRATHRAWAPTWWCKAGAQVVDAVVGDNSYLAAGAG